MSLIQDALKRQQEESESSQVPLKAAPARPPASLGEALRAGNAGAVATAGRAAPFVPDAMPVPPIPEPANRPLPVDPEKPVQSGKSWKLIAGIIIFCILIVWGGGLLVVLVLKQSAEHTLPGPLMPDLTKAQATLGKPAIKAPPPAAQPSAAAMPKPVVTPSPSRASASIPWISPAAAAAPAFADEGEDVEDDVVLPSVNKQELPVTEPIPVPVVWPRLKLSAIFSNVGSGQSGARLNNRLILLGDQIEGVTLVEIRRDSVVLNCGKETRSLKMGMTLN